MSARRDGNWRRIGWFVLLWVGGVAVTGLVALAIRSVLIG